MSQRRTSFVFLLLWAALLDRVTSAPITNGNQERSAKRLKTDAGPRCKPRLNEIKLGWQDDESVTPFIEIKSNCQKRPGPVPSNALGNYILFVVQEATSLALVVNFDTFPFDGSRDYVVIGSPDNPNTDISMGAAHVQSIFSRTNSIEMLPIPSQKSYSILLVYDLTKSEKRTFNLFYNAENLLTARALTTAQFKLLVTRTVDMVVLGESENVKFFHYDSFWQNKNGPIFTTDWLQIRTEPVDMSMSVCNEDYDGFDSAAFFIKPASPGKPNMCQTNIVESTSTEPATSGDEIIEENDNGMLYHSVTDRFLSDIRNFKFQPEWISRCQSKFPKRSNFLQDESMQKWINFEDDECRFTCKPCLSYLEAGFRRDVKVKPKIVTTGFLSSDIYDNKDAVTSHENFEIHTESLQFFEEMSRTVTTDDANSIIKEFEKMERKTLNATMNIVLIVYAQIKGGLSFQTHPLLMKALRRTGGNFGQIQHSADASQSITKIIGKSFHHELLQYLLNQDQPFSIMVDSSTSLSIPFMAVYFQFLEDGYPSIHFYSLIHMSHGEKAREMTDSFIDQIRIDDVDVPGFEQYFKSRIVSFSSDGASVLTGVRKSFKIFLTEYVGRPVPQVVCLAHKLDSSFKNGTKPSKQLIKQLEQNKPGDYLGKIAQLNYFQNFEKLSNDLYNFYSSRGYKRWAHFLNTAEDLGIEPKRYKYIEPIRWSESHFIAIETVHHNLYVVIEDFDKIRHDKDFEVAVKQKAEEYYLRMTDKYHMLVLHEFLDLLSSFKVASKKFQTSAATIVGKVDVVFEVIEALGAFRDELGPWLKDFLKNTACMHICDEGDCTLFMYERCNEVITNGLTFRNNIAIYYSYADQRTALYNNLITSVKNYFDIKTLDAFQSFNPNRVNFEINQQQLLVAEIEDLYHPDFTYEKYNTHKNYTMRLKYTCKFYTIPETECNEIIIGWAPLLKCLILNVQTFETRQDSTKFWPLALSLCEGNWKMEIKNLMGYIMVTPFSSSEVERGFSVMNLIKTKGRSRLDKDNLNNIMTAKINGPNIEDFQVYKYTMEVMKQLARADDSTMKGGRKVAAEKLPSIYSKSRIYRR